MSDLALFDLTDELVAIPRTEQHYDLEAASRFAFLFTSTEHGNSSGIRFAATVEDAKAWCSSDDSQGQMHGVRWAYFWTRVSTFIQFKTEYDGYRPRLDISKLHDNGEWDDRIQAAGCRKIPLTEFKTMFEPMGIEVIDGNGNGA